jgi:hypothetical protein
MKTSTSIIKFGDETEGVYFSSSDAAYYSLVLRDILAKHKGEKSLANFSELDLFRHMNDLINFFAHSNIFLNGKKEPINLLPFEECKIDE